MEGHSRGERHATSYNQITLRPRLALLRIVNGEFGCAAISRSRSPPETHPPHFGYRETPEFPPRADIAPTQPIAHRRRPALHAGRESGASCWCAGASCRRSPRISRTCRRSPTRAPRPLRRSRFSRRRSAAGAAWFRPTASMCSSRNDGLPRRRAADGARSGSPRLTRPTSIRTAARSTAPASSPPKPTRFRRRSASASRLSSQPAAFSRLARP